jgi:peptide/nickel transport system substrate-binding protein
MNARMTRSYPRTGRRPRVTAVVLILLVPFLAACPGDRPERGGTAVVAAGADMDKPHTLISESSLDNGINAYFLYRPLLQPWWEDGELSYLTADENPMALARSYEYFGPDSASLRYRLRTDVRWTDGEPVTAHDAAWTLEIQGDPRLASPRQDYNREIREIVVEDDSTLVIHFTRQYPEMLFHTAGGVSPRHPYEGTDPAEMRSHPSIINPVGNLVTSGPFVVGQWIRGQQVVLERNPDFEPQALLDRVVFRIVPEETTRMIELQTGNVDFAQVPFHFIDDVRAAGHLRIETQERRSYEYISYNPRAHDFFADPDVRRALGLAIDVDGIISGLQMEEFTAAAGGPYAPIFRHVYDPEDQAPLPYDTVQARQILAEKGWVPGSDGILRRDGVPFRFTLLTNAENRRRVDITQIVERQLRRIGVDVRIQLLEFNTVVDRTTRREFEARVGGWGVGLSPDLWQIWGDPDLPFNYVSYDNPEVRRLMELALEQPTEERAAPYWRQAASLIVADQPYTWLFYYDTPYAVNDRLQGTHVNTLGELQQVWEWRIE